MKMSESRHKTKVYVASRARDILDMARAVGGLDQISRMAQVLGNCKMVIGHGRQIQMVVET